MTELNQVDNHAQGGEGRRPLSVSAWLGRLQFHNSGKFRVLQLADIQDGPKVSKDTIALIAAALDAARPDVVVFTGNQIAGYDTAFSATFRKRHWTPAKPGHGDRLDETMMAVRGEIAAFLKPLVDRGIPFAVTYGNHDFQCGLSNEELDAIYREFPGCLNVVPHEWEGRVGTAERNGADGGANVAANDDDDMDANVAASNGPAKADAKVGMIPAGVYDMPAPCAAPISGMPDQKVYPCGAGTFALPVMDADRTHAVLALVVADSGDYSPEGGYGKPSKRTLDFLYSVPEALGAKSLVFQHMPVPQYYDLLKAVEPDAPGAIQGYRAYESQYYVLDDDKTQPGSYLGEGVSCPDYDSGEFALLRDGGYFGIVAGHDHRNGFVGESEGVMMVATPTCGFGSYGPAPEKRAARLFEFDIRHPHHPRTQLLEFGELVGKPSSRKAYSYDIASVKPDSEGMNLLHKKTLWSRIREWLRR
ncbi:metallophosphoesterase [Bifidobacterium simiiventris]|uniref:metallophosphoesterase n=1 Tax=Bifidobacterium simiiventris TaxID=2834434 RepID=UPI001C588727|nr:metallophosphoesterase [Bifidobacterium simiiventris]MBW3079133.1 metallophosphoesterase [Bifidobacterium simiiventris]